MIRHPEFAPMTWKDRIGCLTLLALAGLCWLGPIVMAYRCGQGHPRKPVAIVAQERPSVEIIP
jgi:hypothetical protein